MKRYTSLLALVAVLLVSSGSLAAPAPDWTWTYLTNIQVSEWIEQQSDWPEDPAGRHVVNPSASCAWDVDDHWSRYSTGSLAAGQAVSATDCMVSDHTSYYATRSGLTAWWSGPTAVGRLDLTVDSPSPNLDVTVCYSVQARCFTATPVYYPSTHKWTYTVCTQAAYNQPEVLPSIPGSNGGVGVVDTVTSTITNPTNHTIRKITFAPRVIGVFVSCLVADTQHVDYPFRWWD